MSLRNFLSAIVFVFLSYTIVGAADFPKLLIMTEEYSPYNFQKDGVVQGIAVDVMVEMLKKAGSSQTLKDIELLPWARGYKQVQDQPNAVLFSTTRTKEREKMFKWVCPIASLKTEMIALKEKNIKIASTADFLKYKIGCVRDDVGQQLVIAAGVPENKLDINAGYEMNVNKLNAGRIDLYASSMTSVTDYAKELKMDPNKFESVYLLDESHLCYAFNQGVSDAVVGQLQKALDELIADGTFAKISAKYQK
ncbi:MAG: ABC transporter substrate-binding protein [Proteobacteria bacterium]|nr:ABC transporter substrate-binding protein [Pseudomonadota bacterium]